MPFRKTNVNGTIEVDAVFDSPLPAWMQPKAIRLARNNRIALFDRRIAALHKKGTVEALQKALALQAQKDAL